MNVLVVHIYRCVTPSDLLPPRGGSTQLHPTSPQRQRSEVRSETEEHCEPRLESRDNRLRPMRFLPMRSPHGWESSPTQHSLAGTVFPWSATSACARQLPASPRLRPPHLHQFARGAPYRRSSSLAHPPLCRHLTSPWSRWQPPAPGRPCSPLRSQRGPPPDRSPRRPPQASTPRR